MPEIEDGAGFLGNSLSRIRLFPGIVVNADEPVVPLADADVDGMPASLPGLADEAMARLNEQGEGMPGLMRGFGVNLAIAGEAYLVGRESTDGLSDEEWGVYSSSAIKAQGDRVVLKTTPKDRGETLPDDALVYRIWRRHPQWSGLAHSNMRAALDTAEELLIYGRQLRAVAKSRASAGVLLIPDELDPPVRPRAAADGEGTDPDAQGQGEQLTELERGLVEALTMPIEDDSSAAAVAPYMLRGAYRWLDRVKLLTLARSIDERSLARIEHLIERLAHGLDVPVEVITGMSDANHWTAWAIQDDTYKAYVEPMAQVPAAGIASSFLRPVLLEAGVPREWVRRVVLGLDPAALVTRPNRAQDAKDAYDRGAISAAELRKALGFPESAAPTDAELRQRIRLIDGGAQAPAPPAPDADDEGDGADTTPDSLPAAGRPLTAAGQPLEQLGERLAAVETRLRERLMIAASDAVTDALRRAGTRLRGATQGDPELRQAVNGLPAEEVGPTLGAEVGLTIADPDRLLDGAFDGLHDRWQSWVGQAQAEVAALFAAAIPAAPDEVTAQAALDEYTARAEEDSEAGWAMFAGLLLALSKDRLFARAPEVTEGEFDPTTVVPAGLVRDALARTGGARAALAPVGTAQQTGPGGLAIGPRARRMLDALGAVVQSWRWQVGMPSEPFPPHHALADVEFDSWDAPQLVNYGTFPRSAYFYPGDHRGCQCGVVPVVVSIARPAATQEAA